MKKCLNDKILNCKTIYTVLIASLLTVSCGSSKKVTSNKNTGTTSVSKAENLRNLDSKFNGKVSKSINELLKDAEKYLGAPYKFGGNTSSGFDCSGLAAKVFEENNKVPMTAFPQLSDADIDNILAYTSQPKEEAPAGTATVAAAGGATQDGGVSNNLILGVLAVVLAMLIAMLFFVKNVLNKIATANGVEMPVKEKSLPLWKAFAKNH